MELIHGFTFAPFAKRGTFDKSHTYQSLDTMIATTGCNFITLVPNGLQDTPQSESICYTSEATFADQELEKMIYYIKEKGIKVALKPTVNCKNGTWRAHISFFDEDVPCEPKWCNWFQSYTRFQLHYAKLAERTHCDLFIAGCEMVMSEHREQEWRKLIADIRSVYSGPVTYNTDKYQEHNVKWWDCLDYISSSGYYPIHDWEVQLDRIEKVVQKYNKPFLFAEAGCMSTVGSQYVPNDWSLDGEVDLKGQADWFEEMFSITQKRDWIKGYFIWSWPSKLYSLSKAAQDKRYETYGKLSEAVIYKYYHTT